MIDRVTSPLYALAIGSVGCAFDSGALGDGGGATLDTASSGETTSSTTTAVDSSSTDAGDGSSSSDGTTTFGESESGAVGGAMLELAEAPSYDFGPVPLEQPLSHSFTLSNTGTGPADGLAAQLAPPFAFSGGAWPGTTGTCGASLEGGTACTLDIAFTPMGVGEVIGMMSVDYVDQGVGGSVLAALRGGGAGQTDNLVVNGGGEMVGTPPVAWFDVLGGGWTTTATFKNSGVVSIFAGDGASLVDLELAQPVVTSQWAGAIDFGTLRFRLSAYARTNTLTDDAYRVRLEFLDVNGQTLDTFDTDYQGFANGWTEVTDDRLAPVGTRSVRVVLMCYKVAGATCNAYYDDVALRLQYP